MQARRTTNISPSGIADKNPTLLRHGKSNWALIVVVVDHFDWWLIGTLTLVALEF